MTQDNQNMSSFKSDIQALQQRVDQLKEASKDELSSKNQKLLDEVQSKMQDLSKKMDNLSQVQGQGNLQQQGQANTAGQAKAPNLAHNEANVDTTVDPNNPNETRR